MLQRLFIASFPFAIYLQEELGSAFSVSSSQIAVDSSKSPQSLLSSRVQFPLETLEPVDHCWGKRTSSLLRKFHAHHLWGKCVVWKPFLWILISLSLRLLGRYAPIY